PKPAAIAATDSPGRPYFGLFPASGPDWRIIPSSRQSSMPTLPPAPNDAPLYLRFFDQVVALRSDTPNFVTLFARMYRHFILPPDPALAAAAWPVSLT